MAIIWAIERGGGGMICLFLLNTSARSQYHSRTDRTLTVGPELCGGAGCNPSDNGIRSQAILALHLIWPLVRRGSKKTYLPTVCRTQSNISSFCPHRMSGLWWDSQGVPRMTKHWGGGEGGMKEVKAKELLVFACPTSRGTTSGPEERLDPFNNSTTQGIYFGQTGS